VLCTVRLVAWTNAVLRGSISLDDAADAVAGELEHRVSGLPGEDTAVSLAYAMGRLRALGVSRLRAVLPVPGDPAGLPGPASFNERAVEAGSAAVAGGPALLGLVPQVGRAVVEWQAHPVGDAGEGAVDDLPQTERLLTEALRDATEELARLDVARARPEVLEALQGLREGDAVPLPPGHPQRAVGLTQQALRLLRVVELAAGDDGAAASAGQMRARSTALRHLQHAARRALAVAASEG
jgi:hypothetical protein